MKKLIFQYYFEVNETWEYYGGIWDEYGKAILPYSIKSVKEYAKRIGADYKLCTDRKLPHLRVECEKLRALSETEYDKVLVIDTDIIIPKEIEKDIFEEYKDSKIALRCSPKHLGYMTKLNGGVVLWDKEMIEFLQQDYYDLANNIVPPVNDGSAIPNNDEKFIQECFMTHGFEFTPIDWAWNCDGEEFHEHGNKAYFIHYGTSERVRLIFDETYWVDKV